MKLEYELVYSQRRTIAITVERDRRVVVYAPHRAPQESVAAAVQRKQAWIWSKVRDPYKYAVRKTQKEFVAGEAFLFLGQNYSLELVPGTRDGVRAIGRCFELSRIHRHRGRELFREWYVDEARKRIPPRVVAIAKAMGTEVQRVSVRELKYQWASCTPSRRLSFSWRIIQAPSLVVEYLIVHELAHLLEPNHSDRFWNIVAVHAPAWEKAKDWLRQHGSRLEW
jgi:predicted metal-dependent hydrolase